VANPLRNWDEAHLPKEIMEVILKIGYKVLDLKGYYTILSFCTNVKFCSYEICRLQFIVFGVTVSLLSTSLFFSVYSEKNKVFYYVIGWSQLHQRVGYNSLSCILSN